METIPTKCIILEIASPETVNGGARKQIIKLKQPGFVHRSDASRNGMDNFYEVEVWGAAIEKFNLLENYKHQQEVEVSFWLNGKYRLVLNEHKCEHNLTLKSIKPL